MGIRSITIVGVVAITAGLTALPSAHSASPIYTTITTPKNPSFPNATSPLQISGTASSGVTSVDIYCTYDEDTQLSAPLATAVPVTAGAFSTVTSSIPDIEGGCVLRAIPGPATYVGSFTGPAIYPYIERPLVLDATTVSAAAQIIQSSGSNTITGIDGGGVFEPTPTDEVTHSESPDTIENLGFTNSNNYDDTKAGIIVDGNFAYTPREVLTYVAIATALSYDVPSAAVSFAHSASTGNTTLTITVPLFRCSGANAIPPTTTTCPTVEKTGVSLVSRLSTNSDGRRIGERLQFISTDGRVHHVSVELDSELGTPVTSEAGYELPDGTNRFITASDTPTNESLRPGIITTYVKRDDHAADGDPNSSLAAITQSSKTTFTFDDDHDFDEVVARTVPANGAAGFAYVVSIGTTLAQVHALAAAATTSLTGTLKLTAPKRTRKHKVEVTVHATATGNGLPVSVTVDGHKATLAAHTATTATYHAVVRLKLGKHTITATSTDPGGNRLRAMHKIRIEKRRR